MKLKKKKVMWILIAVAALIVLGAVAVFGINGWVVHTGGKYICTPMDAH